MANLFNPNNNNEPKGFEPTVDNSAKKPVCSVAAKVFFWVFGTLLLFFAPIYFLVKRNGFLRQQNEINEAAGTIETQLAKRSDTLIKLVDQVKSHKNFEQSILTDVTKLRNMTKSIDNASQVEGLTNSVLGRLIAVSENYPDLKTSALYGELMEQTSYLEREIAAARRLYNSKVNTFNTSILVFPATVISSSLHLETYPLFQASAQQRQDVSMKDL
ncbi:LemA family protein [Mycoplasma sp. 480]|uniref:LemA family protein n=1 Tax=Mycoplasma sp. 480 TaxID=3440155 RepID=UPI003F5174C8